MKTQSMLLVALASAPMALAHTIFTDFYVDGMPQGDGVAMRMNPNAQHASAPIASLDSDDMACNVGGTKGVSRVQSVKDGALLTFEIRAWAADPSKERLDRGHKGPCAVYLKKVDSASTDKAAGDGWFKLFDHGYNNATSRWCTDEIIDNNGLLSVHLPKGLEGGDYLARPEILALHAAKDGDPQIYTGCAQIFLESSGTLVPESTVSIPGYMKYGEPSTDFDIYNKPNSQYVVPGPKVAKLTARGVQSGSTSQTDGLKPEGCIMENGNWCGKEVPSYSDEIGCWASDKACWDQSDTCYNTAPPTGHAGCKLWEDKCNDIQAQCNAKNFKGPPNMGKVLTPEKKGIDVGQIMATAGGGVADDAPAPALRTSSMKKEEEKPEATTTPVKASPAAPKPTTSDSYERPLIVHEVSPMAPAPAPANHSSLSKVDAPALTITVAPSSAGAPAPTAAPQVCPKGWKCVTEVELVTTTVYVTATYDGVAKRVSVHQRRHVHRA